MHRFLKSIKDFMEKEWLKNKYASPGVAVVGAVVILFLIWEMLSNSILELLLNKEVVYLVSKLLILQRLPQSFTIKLSNYDLKKLEI